MFNVMGVNIEDFNEKEVRALFREKDESHLWPISGRFNVTERAIRQLRKAQRDGLVIDSPIEYALALDEQISQIVNDENNW